MMRDVLFRENKQTRALGKSSTCCGIIGFDFSFSIAFLEVGKEDGVKSEGRIAGMTDIPCNVQCR
jgi:hypothetical protein